MAVQPGDATLGAAHRSLRELVCDELRRQILVGELLPGTRLVEDRLAESLGVSRNPVREALNVLRSEGFVEIVPRRGALVARLSAAEVEQLFDVRTALEGLAARLAARNAGPATTAALRQLLQTAGRATELSDLDRVSDANTDFHAAVAEASGNTYLKIVSAPVLRRAQWVFRQSAAVRARHSWTEHVALLDAIEAGDEDAAEARARAHVAAALQSFSQLHTDNE